MAILITGRKGFISSHLKPYLESKGERIILFLDDTTKKENFDRFNSKEEIEAVIHLAGKLGGRNKKQIWQANYEGTKNLIEFCQGRKVGRIIFLSTARVLSRFQDPYINSKKEAEKLIVNSGISYIILRPNLVFGPGDKKNLGFLLNLIRRLPLVPVFKFLMQPLFIDDLVKIISASLKMPVNQKYNLVGLETISYYDIIKALKSLGYKLKIINLPFVFNWLIKIFSLTPISPMPYWQVRTLLASEIYQGDNWPKIFKINPTSFREGLKKQLNIKN
ncbi:MAG: NAD(P)-dependent oxidoreductase [Patescibacteria group bacterium]